MSTAGDSLYLQNIPLESSPIQAKKELLEGQAGEGGESSGLAWQHWDQTSPGAPETLGAQRVLGSGVPCALARSNTVLTSAQNSTSLLGNVPPTSF